MLGFYFYIVACFCFTKHSWTLVFQVTDTGPKAFRNTPGMNYIHTHLQILFIFINIKVTKSLDLLRCTYVESFFFFDGVPGLELRTTKMKDRPTTPPDPVGSHVFRELPLYTKSKFMYLKDISVYSVRLSTYLESIYAPWVVDVVACSFIWILINETLPISNLHTEDVATFMERLSLYKENCVWLCGT